LHIDGFIKNTTITEGRFGFDLSGIPMKTRKDKVLRNCVDPEIGKMILNCAMGVIEQENIKQGQLF
jgi:hypothetical protein